MIRIQDEKITPFFIIIFILVVKIRVTFASEKSSRNLPIGSKVSLSNFSLDFSQQIKENYDFELKHKLKLFFFMTSKHMLL